MRHSELNASAPSYIGHVKNGVVVLGTHVDLVDGQAVRVEPLAPGSETALDLGRAERVRELKRLFDEWTEEDAQLPDAQADCLHAALKENRGLRFRSANLN